MFKAAQNTLLLISIQFKLNFSTKQITTTQC